MKNNDVMGCFALLAEHQQPTELLETIAKLLNLDVPARPK